MTPETSTPDIRPGDVVRLIDGRKAYIVTAVAHPVTADPWATLVDARKREITAALLDLHLIYPAGDAQ